MRVYLFNPSLLARMLRDGALSERQKFNIVLFSLAVQSSDSFVGTFWGRSGRGNTRWYIALHLVMALIGTRFCFNANARGDDRNFIERFFCLGVPLSLWLSLAPYALDLAFYYGLYHLYGVGVHAIWHRIYPLLLLWIWGRRVLFYVVLSFFQRIAASGSPVQNLPPTDAPTLAPIAAP